MPKPDIYAYVLWYKATTSPLRDSKLRVVEKAYRAGQRAGGVIKLSDVRGPAPLHSYIIGDCPPNIDQFNAYEKLDKFLLNRFEGHTEYALFKV